MDPGAVEADDDWEMLGLSGFIALIDPDPSGRAELVFAQTYNVPYLSIPSGLGELCGLRGSTPVTAAKDGPSSSRSWPTERLGLAGNRCKSAIE